MAGSVIFWILTSIQFDILLFNICQPVQSDKKHDFISSPLISLLSHHHHHHQLTFFSSIFLNKEIEIFIASRIRVDWAQSLAKEFTL